MWATVSLSNSQRPSGWRRRPIRPPSELLRAKASPETSSGMRSVVTSAARRADSRLDGEKVRIAQVGRQPVQVETGGGLVDVCGILLGAVDRGKEGLDRGAGRMQLVGLRAVGRQHGPRYQTENRQRAPSSTRHPDLPVYANAASA